MIFSDFYNAGNPLFQKSTMRGLLATHFFVFNLTQIFRGNSVQKKVSVKDLLMFVQNCG